VSAPWFRLYHRIIDDEKIRLLAFEDRWHFVALCCLKADGLLDEPESDLKWRKVSIKLGIQTRELEEVCRRLNEVGLVDEYMQPTAWDELQYKSDTSTARVRKYRETLNKYNNVTQRNADETLQKRCKNTDTDTDTEVVTDVTTKRVPRKNDDPKIALEAVLSPDMAAAIIEHRKKMRAPLTLKAAEALAREFGKCTNPNDGAETMLAQGWRGFKADWSTERIGGFRQKAENTFDAAKRIGWFDEPANGFDTHGNVEFLPTVKR
jgi:hypothetical protein